MAIKRLEKTALLRNSNGSIYHLNLSPGELATTIILVGDQNRVSKISRHFDQIEVQKNKREFITHTGTFNGQRVSVVSTGIGTDNIDIVINECDALHNVDFEKNRVKETITPLRFLRIGTCGAIGETIDVGDLVLSSFAIGVDGLMGFYRYQHSLREATLLNALQTHFKSLPAFSNAYVAEQHGAFSQRFSQCCMSGITLTCPGFYGPQYRTMRSPLIEQDILTMSSEFKSDYGSIVNMEMETAGIYALAKLLGHEACSISLVLDNPFLETVSDNVNASIESMIETLLPLM